MSKIYLPQEYLNKPCYQVNNGYIRVFETNNYNSSNVVYDVYINQDYQVRKGMANYSSNSYCDNVNTYTSDVYYRTDFPEILLTFVLLAFVCFWIPWKMTICRLIRKWN